jgi:hypothetical protein
MWDGVSNTGSADFYSGGAGSRSRTNARRIDSLADKFVAGALPATCQAVLQPRQMALLPACRRTTADANKGLDFCLGVDPRYAPNGLHN